MKSHFSESPQFHLVHSSQVQIIIGNVCLWTEDFPQNPAITVQLLVQNKYLKNKQKLQSVATRNFDVFHKTWRGVIFDVPYGIYKNRFFLLIKYSCMI